MIGTDRANLSKFCSANNLVKFRNVVKCSQRTRDHALGHKSVIYQLMMSSQRGDTIICLHPIFEWGYKLRHFGLFVLGS